MLENMGSYNGDEHFEDYYIQEEYEAHQDYLMSCEYDYLPYSGEHE